MRWTAAALVVLAFPLLAGAFDRRTAASPTCGDDVVQAGEQCDGGSDSACPGMCNDDCQCPPVATFEVKSRAHPPNTPGSPQVEVTNPGLLVQFGPKFSLNKATYTRFRLRDSRDSDDTRGFKDWDREGEKPDAILILVPGFEGAAGNFRILAQNLLKRAKADHDLVLEVWAFDRRTHQLEDTSGLELAAAALDPALGENFLFGTELGLPLDPRLTRRAIFYNAQDDIPFLANWTNLVFSRDIDAVVQEARRHARRGNVFLGGHSAGTGFAARYAATDFDITPACTGKAKPGYANLRGLVLLEGTGGSTTRASNLTEDSLDRMIAKFDGGLYGAVRDNAPRCVDGTTPCAIATEATDCAGQTPPKCTLPTTSYAFVPGILNPRIFAVSQDTAIQSAYDLNTGQTILQLPVGAPGNTLAAKVPDLAALGLVIPPATVEGSVGTYVDKDGLIASAFAPFVAMSVGQPGPVVDGILTWKDILHGPLTPENSLGPPPTTLPGGDWGADLEVTRLDRVLWSFFAGKTNFTDWYYPNAGPSTTTVAGSCGAGVCRTGNVGAVCSADADCSQSIDLDSTPLSAPPPAGRGRCDIENLRQAGNIDIPVIAFSGTNGLAPVPGLYSAFALSIGPCKKGACDGRTPRMVNATSPNPAFPSFGEVAGGFQVFVNEGFAHLDVLTAEDNAENHVVGPLSDFIARNLR
jgi:pimeloyl-ACP methyl ester carboxylesterase